MAPAVALAQPEEATTIAELGNLLKAARDFITDEHIRRDIDTALLGGGENG